MAQESIGTARLDIVVDTTQFDTAIAAAKRGTSSMSQAAQADYAKLTAAERRRVDSLVNQANTIEFSRKQQILYNAALRDVPTSILDELKTKLAATGAAAVGAGKQLNQYGLSAAQQAAALRGVPAQLTDIIVSIQGGQQPLTVLLQQGGQLKDMFGGIVPAARALGGALLGLVNPYTLAAAAVAGLTVAWVKGSSEAQSFREGLILSGNAAGVTADNLVSLAHSLGAITGSHSRAVEALSAVASSGRFAGSAISDIALIAAEMQRATGAEIDKTVDSFAKLAKDPVAAVVELNDRYGILNGTIFSQVQALTEQGRAQEAVELVARQAATELTSRTAAQKENLGSLETAWNSLGRAASWAWDKMLDIGREASVDEKIRSAEREVRQRAENIRIAVENGASISERERQGLAGAQALVDSLKTQKKEAEDAAKAEAEQLRINREAIQARQEIAKIVEDGASKAEKRRKAFEALDDRIAKAQKDGTALAASDIKAAREAIERQFKERGTTSALKDDSATRLLAEYAQVEAALRGQLVTQEKLGAWEKRRLEFEQQISDLKEKKSLTADQKSLVAQQDQLRAALDRNVAAEQALRLAQESARVEVMRASLSSSREVEQRQYNDQLAGIGMGGRAQEELRARQAILRDYQRQLDQATRDRTVGKVSEQTYRAETQLLADHLQQRLAMQQAYFDGVKAAEADWANGATSALQDYADEAANVAGSTKSAFTTAFQGIDAFGTTAITKLKLDFRSLGNVAQQVLADIAKALVQQNVTAPLAGFLSSAIGSLAGNWTTTASNNPWSLSSLGLLEGRAAGGPTAPGTFYEVNEQGPELYNYKGRTYLMSGSDGGFVTPLSKSMASGSDMGQAPRITIHNNGTPQDYAVERLTRDDVVLIARDQVYEQGPRMMEGQFGRSGSRGSRAVTKNFKTERNR